MLESGTAIRTTVIDASSDRRLDFGVGGFSVMSDL